MISTNCLRAFIGFGLILSQVSNSWCQDLSPSVVKIYSKEKYLCAGTLVKDQFVVTSGECLVWQKDASALTVVGNVIKAEATPADESPVTDIFRPRDYNETLRYMDVAVLKLEKSIVGPKIKPTKLCSKTGVEEKAAVTVFYWDLGDDEPKDISTPLLLRNINLSVSNKEICAKNYREKFSDTMFCAAERERVDCFYDRGGPLASEGEFCGVYNYGPTCIENSHPGSFTSLFNPKIIQFIHETLEK